MNPAHSTAIVEKRVIKHGGTERIEGREGTREEKRKNRDKE